MVTQLKFQIVKIDADTHSIYPRLIILVNFRAEQGSPIIRAKEGSSEDNHIDLDDLKLDMSILNEEGVEIHLPAANCEQGLVYAFFTEQSMQFHLDLDYFGLSQIEKLRNGKDLILKVKLSFTSYIPSQYKYKNPSSQQLQDYIITKSVWIEHILSAFNFKNVFLLELPKLKENTDTAELAIHLNNALTKLSSGDYPSVLIDCQKALEATKALAKAKGYTRTAENGQEKIDFDKFTNIETIKDALENAWKSIWAFTQPGGRHIGGSRSKEEAQFEILATYGLVNLVIENMLVEV
ncbi:MAG: hypothetical protein QXL94_06540 [Candidatus Parvarchaeum sp.]